MQKLNGFRILVVEDDPDLNEIMCDFLVSENATVVSAVNGKEAFSILENQKIDFVLSDIQMPIMDGFGLLLHILESERSHPPLLFVTGQSKLTELDAKKLGAAGLINKPFNQDFLLQTLVNILTQTPTEKTHSV